MAATDAPSGDREATVLAESGLPVTIVTGFLGSGKTTLLNHILTNNQGVKTAVLVNEFGEIGIDNDLIVSSSDGMVELNNGCVCCTINRDLVEAVRRILEREAPVDYLIVETTGLADPLPVALTFLGTELRERTQLDVIVTVVDCANFSLDLFNSEAAYSQIAYGDITILNKTDLVDSATIASLETRIRQTKEGARLLRAQQAHVPLPLILGIGAFDAERDWRAQTPAAHAEHAHGHLANDGFVSLTFQSDRPFSLRQFQSFLDNELPESVFRGKGILWFDESPQRHIFHLSGKRFSLEDSEWQGERQNQLVLIGQDLDREWLQQRLEQCLK
ncbi:MAG: cobalamin biosynthesis protein CobW [Cyanobacteria bacterium QS_8_64_29]|nr:MAG: cobalamin biosynthesis protein CobW [Cyanobacteria bacterium QS_8_64_29]